MRITLYIPVYNVSSTLGEVLAACAAQTRPADRILVIDDGSTDDSAELARQAGAEVSSHGTNRGLGAARNTALEACDTNILAGLDADVVPAPDYLRRIEQALADDSAVAVCGNLTERHMWTLPDRWRSVHMAQHLGDDDIVNPRFLFGATTAGRADALRAVGGWDARLTRNGEDVDLSSRLRDAGQTTMYIAGARAEHLRRDDAASALDGLWNWFHPAGMLRGDFTSWEAAAQRIEPVTMGIFRHRITQDLQPHRTDLLALTILLPWWMTILDLAQLAEQDGISPDEVNAAAGAVAGTVARITSRGADELLADDLLTILQTPIARFGPPGRETSTLTTPARRYVHAFKAGLDHALPRNAATWRTIADARRRMT